MEIVRRLSRETFAKLWIFGGLGNNFKAQFGNDLAERILCFPLGGWRCWGSGEGGGGCGSCFPF